MGQESRPVLFTAVPFNRRLVTGQKPYGCRGSDVFSSGEGAEVTFSGASNLVSWIYGEALGVMEESLDLGD